MTTRKPATITRRSLLMAGAVVPLCGILTRRASAAEFSYKLATGQDPTHPVNIRAQEAIDRIREATGGRLEIKLFPANQLGSDTELLTQVRNGGVEFFNQSSSILATFVPAAGIVNTGFAFANYESVWQAMDGELGAYVRAQIAKTPIMTVSKVWDNGFRHVTSSGREIRTPDDLKNFKIRVPPAPILTSLFKALEAGPAPINFNEVYSALQTKVVDGQENPLPIIATTQAVRSAEVLQPHRSCMGRLLDTWQQTRLRASAEGRAGDRDARIRSLRDGSAGRHCETEQVAPGRSHNKGPPVHRRRSHHVSASLGKDQLLRGLEGEVW